MNEMIERVALAMYWGRRKEPGSVPVGWGWESEPRELRVAYRQDAREAIAAMREPTARMSTAGKHAIKGAAGSYERDQAEGAWRVMIDEALDE